MTLTSFKYRFKLSLILILLGVYGTVLFNLGRINALKKGFEQVKGVSAKSQKSETDSIEKPLPYSDVQSQSITPSYVKHCSNTTLGFGVDYPKDWFTTYNHEGQQCMYFAPYSFIVPQEISEDFIQIKVEIITPDEWQSTVDYWENPNEIFNVKSSANLEINGRPVKKIETVATGVGVLEKGFIKQGYLVQDSQKPAIISYTQINKDDDLILFEKTIEDMAKSLKYF